MAWKLEPAKRGKVVFPTWRFWQELWLAVRRAPLSRGQRLRCYLHLVRWPLRGLNGPRLARDFVWAAMIVARRTGWRVREVVGTGPS
jgi:hypothetical protein